ncbi:UNVERIFIED_CONTAM: hypothetical protein HDU68_003657 [Siphonaria sp. JEL0065]|nr:hypothetical protein HDU68_003657 [Siphonaria sp. JEL0065]
MEALFAFTEQVVERIRIHPSSSAAMVLGVAAGCVGVIAYSKVSSRTYQIQEINVGGKRSKNKRRVKLTSGDHHRRALSTPLPTPDIVSSGLAYLSHLLWLRKVNKESGSVEGRELLLEPVQCAVINLIRRVVRAAPRVVVIVPPVKRLGTQAVCRAFGLDDGDSYGADREDGGFVYGSPVRYMDLNNNSLTLDVRLWAGQMDQDAGGILRAIGEALVGLVTGLAAGLLGSWADSVNENMPKSKLPALEDEIQILNTFYTVLESTTRMIPDGCTIVIDGVDCLSQLSNTDVGKKAMSLFFNHLAGLARGTRRISICLVVTGAFSHEFLIPLAAQETVAFVSFGDLSKEEAKEHYLERFRVLTGMYTPEWKFGGKLEDRWAKDESLLLTVAEECVDLVYDAFGGRAHDLVACVDCLLLHNEFGGLEDKLRATKDLKLQKEIFMEAATGFPDFAASIRWLEMTLDPVMFSQTIDISSSLENWEAPLWTFEEAVAIFDALVASAEPFLVYQDAVDILFKLRPHSRSEAQLVLRSFILHRIIAYRPASPLHFDGAGSFRFDAVTVVRPLHLYCFKQLRSKLNV